MWFVRVHLHFMVDWGLMFSFMWILLTSDPPVWMPDETSDECLSCRSSFTVLRRKHHCRNCGQVSQLTNCPPPPHTLNLPSTNSFIMEVQWIGLNAWLSLTGPGFNSHHRLVLLSFSKTLLSTLLLLTQMYKRGPDRMGKLLWLSWHVHNCKIAKVHCKYRIDTESNDWGNNTQWSTLILTAKALCKYNHGILLYIKYNNKWLLLLLLLLLPPYSEVWLICKMSIF